MYRHWGKKSQNWDFFLLNSPLPQLKEREEMNGARRCLPGLLGNPAKQEVRLEKKLISS